MKRAFLLLVLFVLVLPTSLRARTWLVRQDGSGDCTTIQAGINSAGNGDTVLVGPGVYMEAISIQSKSDLALKSEQGLAQTRITNGFGGASFYPCISCANLMGESVIEGFTFADCYTASAAGGAIFVGSSALTIRGNVFSCCTAGGIEGGNGCGGAIYIAQSSGNIVQNTFHNCWAGTGGQGGGIYLCHSPNMVIDRNVITACVRGGIWADALPIVTCNDVWGNSPSSYLGAITKQTGMNGNISVDPMFCDPLHGDYALRSDSPCANAPGCGQIGALGWRCGPTAVH
jgi:hypothetical protein